MPFQDRTIPYTYFAKATILFFYFMKSRYLHAQTLLYTFALFYCIVTLPAAMFVPIFHDGKPGTSAVSKSPRWSGVVLLQCIVPVVFYLALYGLFDNEG